MTSDLTCMEAVEGISPRSAQSRFKSGSGAIVGVKAAGRLTDAVGVEPPLPFTLKPRGPLRPHCRRPELCGGYGRVHCYTCLKSAGAATAEADA